jgi:branched-chain amino acid transport system permease protein
VLLADVSSSFTTPLVTGVIQGAVYGLVGLGLVLLYKGNRIFNFAQGEFGTVGAFVAFIFITGAQWVPKVPYAVAVIFGLVAGTLMGLLTERLVIRPLFRQPRVTLVVASAGVALLAVSLELIINGGNPQSFPPVSPGSAFAIGTYQITKQRVTILVVLAILAVLAALFFSRTQTGLAILAVSQEPTAASLAGISVDRISMLTWSMAGFLGAVAGILLAPTTLFAPAFMTSAVLIPSFTAAVFGGMTSLPGAFLGGVSIGIIEQFAGVHLEVEGQPGMPRVAVFVVLLLTLLIRPRGLLGKDA